MSRIFRVGNRVRNLNCTHVRQRVSNNLKTVLRNYWLFWKEFRIWWVLESSGESFLVFKVTTWWCKTCWKRTCEILSHVWTRLKMVKINKDMGKVTNDWPQSLLLWLNITESVIPTVPFEHLKTSVHQKPDKLIRSRWWLMFTREKIFWSTYITQCIRKLDKPTFMAWNGLQILSKFWVKIIILEFIRKFWQF